MAFSDPPAAHEMQPIFQHSALETTTHIPRDSSVNQLTVATNDTNDVLTDTPIANVIRFYKGRFSTFSMFSRPPFGMENFPIVLRFPQSKDWGTRDKRPQRIGMQFVSSLNL